MLTRRATQRIVIGAVIAVIAAALGFFIYRGWNAYLSGPSLVVTEPADYAAFSTPTTTIAGTASRIQNITLDSRPITIDESGAWSQTILLLPGYNIETVVATDRFGHTVSRTLELVYLAPAPVIRPAAATSTATTTGQ